MLTQILIVMLLSLPPILFWGYFFYRKDRKEPEPLGLLARSFWYGMFAAFFVILLQLAFSASKDFNLVRLISSAFRNEYVMYIVLFSIIGFIEEYAKETAFVKLVHESKIVFHQIIDGIEYAVMAALGFAFVENVAYFFMEFRSGIPAISFFTVFLFRSVGTVLAHAVFSGIFGYFYAVGLHQAHVNGIRSRHPHHHFHRHFHKACAFRHIRKHIFEGTPGDVHDPGVFITEGLLVAAFLHMLFNFFNTVRVLGLSLAPLNVPLLMLSLWFLLKMFKKRGNVAITS